MSLLFQSPFVPRQLDSPEGVLSPAPTMHRMRGDALSSPARWAKAVVSSAEDMRKAVEKVGYDALPSAKVKTRHPPSRRRNCKKKAMHRPGIKRSNPGLARLMQVDGNG